LKRQGCGSKAATLLRQSAALSAGRFSTDSERLELTSVIPERFRARSACLSAESVRPSRAAAVSSSNGPSNVTRIEAILSSSPSPPEFSAGKIG
jgi:hypothetical protein